MKLLILGAGGIGGYLGGRLAESGADVTFLVRPGRRDQLVRDGLVVESPLGNVSMPVRTVTTGELKPGYDLVLLTCKAYDLDSAMDAIAPAVNAECCVLPMLNGMSHIERLAERFGRNAVLGGACAISVTLRPDGTIVHAGQMQRMVFGELDRSRSPRTEALAKVLGATKIDWELAPDIVLELWEKIVMLSALAAVTCLFRANIGEIMSAPGGREAVDRVLATNIEIATREGHAPRAASIARARAIATDPTSKLTASMLRDMESGGQIESDHIIGWMLDRARAHRLDDTVLSMAYTHLKAYEARRAARGG